MSNTMQNAVQDAVSELSSNVEAQLTVEQKAALESKFNALPPEVRSSVASKYPQLTVVGQYIVRQMVKEANGKMASQQRPIWFTKLELNAASLISKEPAISEYAEEQLRGLAEELDSKESVTLIKKYKNTHDMTSKDARIVRLAGIFGVNPTNIA